jgi:Winged helix DNA-binding domain
MRLTARQLNRAVLARQMLLAREPVDVADAVGRATAIQAQEPASVYIALWNRVARFDPADLDLAYASHVLMRSISIRITLHTVRADEYPTFHAAMVPNLRASRLGDRRLTATGYTAVEVDEVLPHVHAHLAEARSTPEIESWLAQRFGRPAERVWWALKTFGPFVHAPDGGPWSFASGRTFRAAPAAERPDHTDALAFLLRRYLEGFGPATAQDFGLFAMQRRPAWTAAIGRLGGALVTHEGPDGRLLYDVPGGAIPDGDTPAPVRLLPMWDNVLLAHVDRSRIIPGGYRPHVIRRNGDTLPTVLVDGHVAGVWRPARDGRPGVEVATFTKLPAGVWADVEAEASSLAALLAERDPNVYRRYDHWWDDLPVEQRRTVSR